ncbi:MAG: hypothetical protein Q9168_001430 [Polycauliona sp. 1 TL-2023]
MGFQDSPGEIDLNSQDAPQHLTQRPPKKKKSLTRLFTASRSSSRSRAPSIEEGDIPSTPTIPQQYLSSSRKASNGEPSVTTSHGRIQSVQPVLQDVTNTAVVPDGNSDSRTHSFRGILRSKPKVAHGQGIASDYNGPASPTAPSSIRSRKSSLSHKSKKERSQVQHRSIIPQARKDTHANVKTTDPLSPHYRPRGGSATSLSIKNLQTIDDMPPRPSTSGGERGRTARSLATEVEDFKGLDLNLTPPLAPSLSNDQDVRASLRSAMTTASSILEPSTARSSVMTKGSDTTVESPPRDLEDEGMTVDEAIGMYENGFVDDDSDHDVRSASSIKEEERRRSNRIAEAINDTIGPLSPNPGLPPAAGSLEPVGDLRHFASIETAPRVPSIMLPTVTRDQYGFLKASRYVDAKHFDSWESTYAPDQVRRAKKWL